MRKFVCLTAILLLLLIAVSCGQSDGLTPVQRLIGTSWKTMNTTPVLSIIFVSETACKYGLPNIETTFGYTINTAATSGEITLSDGIAYSFTISGDTLSFKGFDFIKQ